MSSNIDILIVFKIFTVFVKFHNFRPKHFVSWNSHNMIYKKLKFQIRFGAKYHYSDHGNGVAGINSIVTAKCPTNSIMKCNGASTSKCIWDGKKLIWDNSQKCSCYKACAPPHAQITFNRNVILLTDTKLKKSLTPFFRQIFFSRGFFEGQKFPPTKKWPPKSTSFSKKKIKA